MENEITMLEIVNFQKEPIKGNIATSYEREKYNSEENEMRDIDNNN